jgi:subtilisin family serine protease
MPKNSTLRFLVRASLGLVATAAIAAPFATQAQSAERKRVIVVFEQAANANDRAMLAGLDGRVKLEIAELNAFAVDLPVKAVAKLQANKRVKYVEDDTLQYALGAKSGDRLAGPAGITAQETPYGITMVQADLLPGTHAQNRRVCIIDSGYELAHEDLTGNNATGENLTRSGDWDTDELHHGTHVGGTVSAINNNLGVVGVLPNGDVSLYIVKVFDESGSAPSSLIAEAMVHCGQHHSNVISMSLGGSAPSQLQQTAARLLDQKGVLMIAAAGNGGNSAISYPAGYAEVVSVGALDSNMNWATFSQFNDDVELSAPGVTVLSTVPMGTGTDSSVVAGGQSFEVIGMEDSPFASATAPLADFGLGDTIDPAMNGNICLIQRGDITFAEKVQNCEASGGLGAVIYNNVPGPLLGTLAGAVTHIPSVGADGNDGPALLAKVGQTTTVTVEVSNYALFDGTSMATPHVSAVAALVWSYYPDCTATQIRKSLARSSMDLGDPGRDTKFGFGLVQAKDAFVRINALGCGN